ncbi:hypothetical protein AAHA92_21374 [Salvia divinorum]|uniref:Uncharacterized protein n=1 Tax=Salvia divinorum TaxID=28513 RepID=A0ABD1GLG6_SALDI
MTLSKISINIPSNQNLFISRIFNSFINRNTQARNFRHSNLYTVLVVADFRLSFHSTFISIPALEFPHQTELVNRITNLFHAGNHVDHYRGNRFAMCGLADDGFVIVSIAHASSFNAFRDSEKASWIVHWISCGACSCGKIYNLS